MLTSKLPCQQTHKWWLTYKKLQPERALLPYILILRLLFQSKILSLCLWVKAGRFYSETLPNLCLQSYGTDLMIIMITFYSTLEHNLWAEAPLQLFRPLSWGINLPEEKLGFIAPELYYLLLYLSSQFSLCLLFVYLKFNFIFLDNFDIFRVHPYIM